MKKVKTMTGFYVTLMNAYFAYTLPWKNEEWKRARYTFPLFFFTEHDPVEQPEGLAGIKPTVDLSPCFRNTTA